MSLIWGRILENGASVYSVEEQVVEAIGGPDGYLSSLGTEKDELSIILMIFLLVYELYTSRGGEDLRKGKIGENKKERTKENERTNGNGK